LTDDQWIQDSLPVHNGGLGLGTAPAPGKYDWGAKVYVGGAYQNHITPTPTLALGRKSSRMGATQYAHYSEILFLLTILHIS